MDKEQMEKERLRLFLAYNNLKVLHNKFGDKLSIEELEWIKENYIFRAHVKKIMNQNKKLQEKMKELEEKMKEYEKDISEEVTKRFEEKEKYYQNLYKNAIDTRMREIEEIVREKEEEIKTLSTKIEKWKAMYTGQCEANRILINKLGGTDDK